MRLLSWLTLVVILSACGPQYIGPPVGDRSTGPARIPHHHQVRKGDTLFSTAFLYGVTVDELAAWNDIRKPYTIYKGQQLRLTPPPRGTASTPAPAIQPSQPKPQYRPRPPVPMISAAPSRPKISPPPAASVPKVDMAAKAQTSSPATAAVIAPVAVPDTPGFSDKVIWGWPADGRLVKRYDAKSAGKKGIDISGRPGAPVRAAAAGKVVYAGSGLSGYGRLIIIKHNKDFLSAYAHNRKLLAHEGQWVKKHEVIAHMGSSGSDRTALHFEIRKRGRPVDPLGYLPRR